MSFNIYARHQNRNVGRRYHHQKQQRHGGAKKQHTCVSDASESYAQRPERDYGQAGQGRTGPISRLSLSTTARWRHADKQKRIETVKAAYVAIHREAVKCLYPCALCTPTQRHSREHPHSIYPYKGARHRFVPRRVPTRHTSTAGLGQPGMQAQIPSSKARSTGRRLGAARRSPTSPTRPPCTTRGC